MDHDIVAGSYRISPWTGEFVDRRVEAEYRRRRSAVTTRHAIIAIGFSALCFLLFGVTDWLTLGWTPMVEWLIALRVGVLAVGMITIWRFRRAPRAAGDGVAVSVFEIAAFLVFGVVLSVRPEPVEVFGMSMVAMLAAVYLFIPNRLLFAGAVGFAATAGFLVCIAHRVANPLPGLADLIMLLFLVNLFGFLAARRLSVAWREEFRLLARAEQANIRLAEEIERRRSLEHKLTRLATTDSLTGLCNRRRYLELSRAALQRAGRNGKPVALMLLDIDFFKRVNDTYGHSIGDDALRTVTRVLRHEVRGTDILARFGGEEFAVTLPDTPVEQAQMVAERIRIAISHRRIPGARPDFRLTATLGVAVHAGGSESIEGLLNRADRALYEGKTGGRNRVVVLAPVAVRHGV